MKSFPTCIAFMLGLALAGSADALNVPIASRVIAFVQPPYLGPIQAGVVFEPGNAASEAEADMIEQDLLSGVGGTRTGIHVRRIPATALNGLSGVRVAFVTTGIRDQQELAEVSSRFAVLTITSDLSCVQAARCVLGVSSTQRARIVVNRAAAKASRIRFGTAFLMLVKEI